MKNLIISISLLLCAPFASGAEIEFWHSMAGDKGKLLEKIVDEFNAQNSKASGNKIKLQFVGSYVEGINKLRTAMMGKKGPHLMQVYEIGTQVLIDSGAIEPLHTFTKNDKTFPTDKLLSQIKNYYEVNGSLYSLPFATSNPIVYYNKDWFDKAKVKNFPDTFEDLKTVGKKFVDEKSKKTAITWPLHSWFFEQFMARQGQNLIGNENGRSGYGTSTFYTSDKAVRFVSTWKELVNSGLFANVGRGWDPAEQNFLAGRSAMLVTSTSDVFEIDQKASFKVGTAPIFKFKDTGNKGGTIVGGNSIWILKGKPKSEQQTSYEFIKYMASKDVQRKWHLGTGYFPIRTDVIDELKKEGFYKKHPNAWTAIKQLMDSEISKATQGALMGTFPEAREHIETAIEEVLSSNVEVKTALKRASDRTEKSLKRYSKQMK